MLWNNPFTTAMGAATAVVTILHGLGVALPIDPVLLSGIFTSLGLFAAKDGSK
jgi:hypothetical protein